MSRAKNTTFKERWKTIPTKTKRQLFWFLVVLIICTGYVVWDVVTIGPLMKLFNNRNEIAEVVEKAGLWGPVAFTSLQVIQTVIAPIPGGAIGPIGGFLFGPAGIIYTLIGSTIGAVFIFWVAKRYGREMALKLMGKENLSKFDIIPQDKAEMMIFALFLIPGLPDDAISYLAGLTKVPIGRLTASWVIGRFPAVVVANFIGMGFSEGSLTKVVVFLSIAAISIGFVAIENKKILAFLKNHFGDERKERKTKKN